MELPTAYYLTIKKHKMSKFTVRVELHHATEDDYKLLHEEMESYNFSRIISDTDTGEEFHLPTAEYRGSSPYMEQSDVAKIAEKAALKTERDYSILVTKSAGTCWIGLPSVKSVTST